MNGTVMDEVHLEQYVACVAWGVGGEAYRFVRIEESWCRVAPWQPAQACFRTRSQPDQTILNKPQQHPQVE